MEEELCVENAFGNVLAELGNLFVDVAEEGDDQGPMVMMLQTGISTRYIAMTALEQRKWVPIFLGLKPRTLLLGQGWPHAVLCVRLY